MRGKILDTPVYCEYKVFKFYREFKPVEVRLLDFLIPTCLNYGDYQGGYSSLAHEIGLPIGQETNLRKVVRSLEKRKWIVVEHAPKRVNGLTIYPSKKFWDSFM